MNLLDGTKISHSLFNIRSNKAFIIHLQEALNFCNQKGYFKNYQEAEGDLLEKVEIKSDMAKDKEDQVCQGSYSYSKQETKRRS